MKWSHMNFINNLEWTGKCKIPCRIEEDSNKEYDIILGHEFTESLKLFIDNNPKFKNKKKALISTESIVHVLHKFEKYPNFEIILNKFKKDFELVNIWILFKKLGDVWINFSYGIGENGVDYLSNIDGKKYMREINQRILNNRKRKYKDILVSLFVSNCASGIFN
jgi:hypothetical protein